MFLFIGIIYSKIYIFNKFMKEMEQLFESYEKNEEKTQKIYNKQINRIVDQLFVEEQKRFQDHSKLYLERIERDEQHLKGVKKPVLMERSEILKLNKIEEISMLQKIL